MTRKLRVVRVVTASFIVPWHLGNMLKQMPRDFEVCVVGQGVSDHKDTFPGIKWVDIDINRKLSVVSDLVALKQLCSFLIEYKPDVVHSVMHKAALLTAIAGYVCRVPVRINTFTSQYWATKRGLPRWIYYASDWIVNRLNTLCLTDSPSQSEYLKAYSIHRNGEPLPVLVRGSLSGVDLERFDRERIAPEAGNLRVELGIGRADFVFTYLARKNRSKGAFDVLHAFEMVRKTCANVWLLFVGPDESDGELAALRVSRPDLFERVIDIDRAVTRHEIYLGASDVLCLPSYMEGFGSVVIEAAAIGVPTIGSNIPGLVDSISDGESGILFPAGDVNRLAEIMTDFARHPDKYAEMRAQAMTRVNAYFSADQIYGALKDCYQTLSSRTMRGESHR